MRKPPLWQQIETLSERFTPTIRKAFLSAVQDIKDRAILSAVIKAVEAGDPVQAFRALGFSDAAMRPLEASIEAAYEAGGVTTAASFPALDHFGTRAVFRFDVRNSRAEAWLRNQSSTLVTRISDDQLTAIRNVMTQGIEAGINPRSMALDIVGRIDPVTGRRIGGIVGLSGPQEQWVRNARRELTDPATADQWFARTRRDKRFDGIVRKSVADGVALPPATVDKLVTRYSDSLLQLRGETIGRTEALASLNQSAHEAFQQAIDTGAIKNNQVQRVWDATGDARTRDDHKEMDGQTVGMNQAFHAPDGSLLMYPGDTSLGASPEETINCRCRVRMAVDWLADAGD